ncbi:YncE family protein [Mucilaginibacter angelicae]|uniref:YncE family protein n=1 Tax=Mucilaginibacter angelicae TaxID=869718 RepID=A0ABV6LBB6_9SPHI
MKKLKIALYLSTVLIVLLAVSCRKAPQVIPEQVETIFTPDPSSTIKGLYLLNEGNMNMNKASLDFVNFRTGVYQRNIYNQANPSVTKGLGDVGNDIGIYGSKMYVVVNISNKVEVLDVKTAKKLAQIDITNCRYVTFHKNKAYVSAYLGKVGDPKAPNGIVAEIDTGSLQITRKVTVGRQPEEMAIVGEKLYIANSGGYSPPDYERTVSVIDLASFTELKRIDVAINLERVKADKYGDIYVTSRGDYYTIPSKLFVIDTQTDAVKKTFDIAASNLWIDDDTAYIYSTEWSYPQQKNIITYAMLNVKDEAVLSSRFITDGTDKKIVVPYGIAVNPLTKDVFVTDAGNYVASGTLYCFDKNGIMKWQVQAGDIPAHMAFVY